MRAVAILVASILVCGCATSSGTPMAPVSETFPRALQKYCAPFVLGQKTVADIDAEPGVYPAAQKPPQAASGPSFSVGSVELTITLTTAVNGERQCDLVVEKPAWIRPQARPSELRQAMQEVFKALPFPFAVGGYQYPPNRFAFRETYCTPVGAPHLAGLVSTAPDTHGPEQPAIIVTLRMTNQREPRCDQGA